MGKRQARKKDIRLKSFPETGPSLFQTGLQQEEKCLFSSNKNFVFPGNGQKRKNQAKQYHLA